MIGFFCQNMRMSFANPAVSRKLVGVLVLASILPLVPMQASKGPLPSQVSIYVAQMLERGHLTRQPLDGAMSRKLLDNYLQSLDYNRMFFTQQDVDMLYRVYGDQLHDYIQLGNPAPVYEIYKLYQQRVSERISHVKNLLKQKWDFTGDEVVEINRSKAPWPANEEEANALWEARICNELLQEELSEYSDRPPTEVVLKRYTQLLHRVANRSDNKIVYDFLAALSRSYDPHSEYMDPDALENFQISMKLSLVGIGAVLRSEDGFAQIVELVPGGPADRSGKLAVKDKIAEVAQGDNEFVDVFDMELDEVVKMIRGKKGTTVRLKTLPANAIDPSQREIVSIVRDKVELKQQEAKAEIIERTGTDGRPERLGWITLPSFYADMERSPASRDAKSTTRDVAILLERLKKEKIEGLVIDLRSNGGGSLEEAVNLTGLFIKNGPVVQAKDTQGNITISRDRDSRIAYDGPLVVLTSRLSASASEIFAGALQDYNRAVIVGDKSTFGKGTVQTMLSLGQFMTPIGSKPQEAGALKLTIQQFYLPSGRSTQLRGVASDIVLPTLTDQKEIGESSLNTPLPYDEVAPLRIEKFADAPLHIEQLRQRSEIRVSQSPEFGYLIEDLARLEARKATNVLSLNLEQRRAEIESDKARREKRMAERASHGVPKPIVFEITLDNVNNPELQLASNTTKKSARPPALNATESDTDSDDEEEGAFFDAERYEALNILSDLVDLMRLPRTASVRNSDKTIE